MMGNWVTETSECEEIRFLLYRERYEVLFGARRDSMIIKMVNLASMTCFGGNVLD